ncbi:MAG: DUF493 domain-containing protein [Victivallales bacterium]|nr:DUF493 domain-containing protein [Victivallales bacterium]
MSAEKQKIEFPTEWSYRIISAADDKTCPEAIRAVLRKYGIDAELEVKDRSASGKYQAYRLQVVFESREMMEALSSALATVAGVKFIL